jgi:Skp family chaperone for outer membrane proteins
MNKVLSCIAATILCASALGAQDGPGGSLGALAQYLNLSAAQAEELQTLQNRFVEEIKGIQEEIREKKARIQAELQSEFPDANLIGQLMIEIKKLNEKKMAVKAQYNEPALAILNAEQVRLLGPLKMALRLIRVARQAVHFNLIVWGDSGESDESPL